MALNTKIQFRRGYSAGYDANLINNRPIDGDNTWKGSDTLAEGEIGYEVDTGKFKIGKYIDGTAGAWESLPYAGGSALTAESGIVLKLDQADNAYSIYSYITGVAGGQEGITFSVHPASEILTAEDGEVITGTYYKIALSDKLEIFHDSNISVSGNDISSTSTGITIKGFQNSTISLNPDGGTVQHSGVNIRNLFLPPNTNITVTENVGGLTKGTVLTNASGIVDVLQTLLEKVFEPTIGNGGGVTVSLTNSSAQEVGTELSSFTISSSFNRGFIAGTGLGANWDSTGNQNFYLGAANNYTIDGVDRDLNTSYNKGTHTVTPGSNSFSVVVDHDAGPTPINSLGATSTTLSAASAGSKTNSASFTGFRGLFYGWSKDSSSILSSSSEVRGLVSNTSDNFGIMVNPSSRPYSFQLQIPEGVTRIVVAVPSGYNNFGNNINVINAANLPETYNTYTVNVEGANSYSAIPYFVHHYIPAAPFNANTSHTITVS